MLDLAIDNRIFLDNEIDCAVQELDLLFNTVNTELIGAPDFGTEFESFLWTLTPTTDALEQYIREKINTNGFYLHRYNLNITSQFLKGEYRSIYYIQIELTDPGTGDSTKRTYRLQ